MGVVAGKRSSRILLDEEVVGVVAGKRSSNSRSIGSVLFVFETVADGGNGGVLGEEMEVGGCVAEAKFLRLRWA